LRKYVSGRELSFALDGEDFRQFDEGGEVAEHPSDDQLSGEELLKNLKTICVKKVWEAKFDFQEA